MKTTKTRMGLSILTGALSFVGSANAARGLDQPHHSPRFDFDEDALLIGTRFLLEVAREALVPA